MTTRSTVRRSLFVAGALVAAFSFEMSAAAETDSERAARLYQKGNAAVEQKNWSEAEAAYREAWKLARTFDVAANLGLVELRLGNYRAAAEFLAYSIRNVPPSSKPAQRQRTQQLFDEARAKVGAVRVKASVPDAVVSIDGARITPDDVAFDVFIDPGTHTLEAQRDGYQSARTTVELKAGEAKEAPLTLAPLPPERRSVVPGAVLGSVAGAALVTGIGLFVAGRSKGASGASERDAILKVHHSCVTAAANYDPRCPDVESTATAANTFQKAGVGLMVGAGVAAIGTVIFFVLPASSASARSGGLRVSPALSPSLGGLVFSGAF
jgi:hypothetical protein